MLGGLINGLLSHTTQTWLFLDAKPGRHFNERSQKVFDQAHERTQIGKHILMPKKLGVPVRKLLEKFVETGFANAPGDLYFNAITL